MDEDEELPGDVGVKERLKTIKKLTVLGSFFAEEDPGLSSFYISTAHNIITTLARPLTGSDAKKPVHSFCPACGTVFNADNVRVRHHAKRAPSSGRWANHLARGTIRPSMAPKTRARIERLAKARNKTVITCLTCQKTETVLGALRAPREERWRHQTAPQVDVQESSATTRKKKKRRRKDPNAGLKIPNATAPALRKEHVVSLPSSSVAPTMKLPSKHAVPKQSSIARLKVPSNTNKLMIKPSAGGKQKKRPKQMMNQLQTLLAAQDNKNAKGNSLSLFLSQV